MPKVTLEFNLPEDREEYEDTINGVKYKMALDAVWERIFRPRHKHGYANSAIEFSLESETAQVLMDELEKIYHGIIDETY